MPRALPSRCRELTVNLDNAEAIVGQRLPLHGIDGEPGI